MARFIIVQNAPMLADQKHSNEKPFQCSEFGWKFKSEDSMKQHIKIVH